MKEKNMKQFKNIKPKTEIKPKKIKLSNEEQQAKKKKLVKKAKLITTLAMISLMIAGIVVVADYTIKFFRENTILTQAPITVELHKPIEIVSLSELYRREQNAQVMKEIEERVREEYLNPKPEVKCEPTEVESIDPKAFFATLRQKESSNGTNTNPVALHNYCADKGMWNEIGYSPSTKFCFKDAEEAELYVAYYIKKNCDGKTQAQCECYWNTGNMTDSCHYSNNELSKAN